MLNGDQQSKDMSCNGANVYINGNSGHFTLHGGCKALFLHGNDDIVHVELTPGAQIAIRGNNSLVYVRLTEAGPNPKLLITGQNSRAFLVQHLDDTSGTEVPASLRSGALPNAGPVVAVTDAAAQQQRP
jgi:hypothetical protein